MAKAASIVLAANMEKEMKMSDREYHERFWRVYNRYGKFGRCAEQGRLIDWFFNRL